ncbi:MAG: alpha/beta hydrolase [Gammaproteobacteria bacterium]|nr:alpha/beta hydrolase [Gammaproteobacteria bacterium]
MTTPTHHFETVNGVRWHWAEMGEGDPVVLLHGIPESWQCWKHQMPTLATQFRVLAFDLKGYGQSDKADGDYSGNGVASELLACLDAIGIDRFRLAGHDWGVIISDHIINQAPERVERYARCCLSLHRYDVRNSLHHQWNGENPDAASRLMAKPEAYVRVWMDSSCKPGLGPDATEMESIVAEFANDGVAEAVPRYFRDIRNSTAVDYSKFTMPVLYVHGEHDPRQPIEYCRGMEEHIPGLEAIMVLDAGHFVTREQPLQMTQALMWFYNSMLGSGVKLFDRSRHYGLPTMPVKSREGWGVNAFSYE